MKAQAPAEAQTGAAAEAERERDVIPWLRALGCSAERARGAAELCAHIPDAPLEERVRVALRGLAPNHVRRALPVAISLPSGVKSSPWLSSDGISTRSRGTGRPVVLSAVKSA